MNHKKIITAAGFIVGILCLGIGLCIMVLRDYHNNNSMLKSIRSYAAIDTIPLILFIILGIVTVTIVFSLIRIFCCCRNVTRLRSDEYIPLNQEIADDNIIAESDV